MGDWTIHIEGTGAHHNRRYNDATGAFEGGEGDANHLAADLINKLVVAGQNVVYASFTSGGRDEL